MNNKVYKLMNWPKIEEIIYSECDDPQTLLGPHKEGNQTLVQAWFPGEESAEVVLKDTGERFLMEKADDDGYFAALLPFPEKNLPGYFYEVSTGGVTAVREEAYRFEPQITRQDTEKFKNGIHYTIYEKLGAHPMELDGVKGTCFAVWAPFALRVSVVGDFNGWDGRIHQMRRLWDSGIFELFVPGAEKGQNYKFELKLKNGLTYLKSDPYGNAAQLRPDTASVIADLNGFVWEDGKFIADRPAFQTGNAPISVYEMYLGSFAVPEEGQQYTNYRQIAEKLIPYVKEMGYTHVELMPVMEHPFDASWGYQVIGYYAPTSRYGTPEDFMYFVNELHKAGIGVILDWVPAHFPRDAYGLSNFDGTCLYEHKDPRQGFHPHWGTLIYNYGRPEVSNYLIANALFWVEKFHADGIRMDAVASMLYLDYGKRDGGWIPNIYGGNENLEAIEMIKHLNSVMKKRNPGAITVAEESTAFPRITGALDEDGLGFDYKWNMGFMNDYLGYIRCDPYFRSYHHGELTFSMIYAYSERFMLVFSHDEVVHGKSTLLGKMPGDREQKFANLRLSYGYMMTHPGRKLLFMGQDIGEFDEWNEGRQVEWELCSAPEHEGIRRLVRDLNGLYRSLPALHSLDDSPEGFQWINHISAKDCYLTYVRMGEKREDMLLVAANFAGAPAEITTGVPAPGRYKEILNTDDVKYGGTGVVNGRAKRSKAKEWDDRPHSITVKLAPLSVSILKYIPDEPAEMKPAEKKAGDTGAKPAEKKAGDAGAKPAEKKAGDTGAKPAEKKAGSRGTKSAGETSAEEESGKEPSAKKRGGEPRTEKTDQAGGTEAAGKTQTVKKAGKRK